MQSHCNRPSFLPSKFSCAMLVALGGTLPLPALAADSLIGLGNLPDCLYCVESFAIGVSADGSTVVGYDRPWRGPEQAFRWTQAGGMVGLGYLPDDYVSGARGVSADGSVVVGYSFGVSGHEAFRWTQAGGMVGLGYLPDGTSSVASGVSADGSVVVGHSSDSTGGSEAFRWTQASGMVSLGHLPYPTNPDPYNSFGSRATGVSADGSVVVGASAITTDSQEAFRWTQASGMVGLGALPGGTFSAANGVSADGAVVVGESGSSSRSEAFRWTQAGGMVGLGYLPGITLRSTAKAVSADGAVVVGASSIDQVEFYPTVVSTIYEAFRWTQAGGMVSVAAWMQAAGVSTADWSRLNDATGTNYDGSVVVGYGNHINGRRDAYIARVGGDSGIVGLTDLRTSLAAQVAPQVQLEGVNALALNGAHHRPLMDFAMMDGQNGGWVSGDLGRIYREGNGWASLAEVGACRDFANKTVRAGLGVGHGRSSLDQEFNGHSRLDGQYLLTEVDWNIPSTNLIASLLGMSGRGDADLRRGYSAGAGSSTGDTDTASTALRARLDWRDAWSLSTVRFTPSLQFTEARTEIDGYQETGGTTPARFDGQRHSSSESRLGLTGAYAVNSATTLYGHAEWVHRFDSEAASISGGANVLNVVTIPFDIEGNPIRQDWVRLRGEVAHTLGARNSISASGSVASAGQDADLSLGLHWTMGF